MPFDFFAYDAAERHYASAFLRHCHAIFADMPLPLRHFMLSPLLFIFFHLLLMMPADAFDSASAPLRRH
jgi:membrane-anchored glycerophosphoryl diester phosphodiesterase (GDPDase)